MFGNPVGSLTSLVFFRAKALQKHILYGSCSETEVSEQLYLILFNAVFVKDAYNRLNALNTHHLALGSFCNCTAVIGTCRPILPVQLYFPLVKFADLPCNKGVFADKAVHVGFFSARLELFDCNRPCEKKQNGGNSQKDDKLKNKGNGQEGQEHHDKRRYREPYRGKPEGKRLNNSQYYSKRRPNPTDGNISKIKQHICNLRLDGASVKGVGHILPADIIGIHQNRIPQGMPFFPEFAENFNLTLFKILAIIRK